MFLKYVKSFSPKLFFWISCKYYGVKQEKKEVIILKKSKRILSTLGALATTIPAVSSISMKLNSEIDSKHLNQNAQIKLTKDEKRAIEE